jgi:nucleotide-binding universal stress UspA family protein
MSSHGRSGLTGWNISSVVQKVLMRAATSSMIVRAYQPVMSSEGAAAYRRLMMPLDGSQRAECVLPLVSSLGRMHDSTVIVSHVARKPEVARRAPPTPDELELVERITQRNREEGESYLTKIAAQLPLRVKSRMLVGDNVTKCLQQIADEEQPDLVVVSAHGYSGESQWPYGSTTMSFIVYGTSPLLVVQDLAERAGQRTPAERAAEETQGAVAARGPATF